MMDESLILSTTAMSARREIIPAAQHFELWLRDAFFCRQARGWPYPPDKDRRLSVLLLVLGVRHSILLLNQKNLASDYLGKFADLIRMYLNHSTKGTITLSEEIEALNQYLDLEKLRFEDSLDYQIQLPNGIDLEAIEIPTMLIQPYVENALKHGLLHRKGNRILSIKFKLDDFERNLICLVEDNGVGRKKAKVLSLKRAKSHLSFGTKITQNRLVLLNQGNTNEIVIKIEDVYSQAQKAIGTRVHITIPITNT